MLNSHPPGHRHKQNTLWSPLPTAAEDSAGILVRHPGGSCPDGGWRPPRAGGGGDKRWSQERAAPSALCVLPRGTSVTDRFLTTD